MPRSMPEIVFGGCWAASETAASTTATGSRDMRRALIGERGLYYCRSSSYTRARKFCLLTGVGKSILMTGGWLHADRLFERRRDRLERILDRVLRDALSVRRDALQTGRSGARGV